MDPNDNTQNPTPQTDQPTIQNPVEPVGQESPTGGPEPVSPVVDAPQTEVPQEPVAPQTPVEETPQTPVEPVQPTDQPAQ